jgi:hypothetical protein
MRLTAWRIAKPSPNASAGAAGCRRTITAIDASFTLVSNFERRARATAHSVVMLIRWTVGCVICSDRERR